MALSSDAPAIRQQYSTSTSRRYWSGAAVRAARWRPAWMPVECLLLENVSSVDRGELLYDDASESPAVRRTDHMGKVTVYACVPQRIGTIAPFFAVVLSTTRSSGR